MDQPQIQDLLEDLAGDSYTVYFAPDENVKMKYPCIVYQRDYADTKFADNKPYAHKKRYQVTVITQEPDDPVPDKVAMLPMSTFNRFFASEYLNHDIYNVYF